MRKGMRSSKQARHAARNVRANATRALDLLTANLRRALSALLAFAMVVTVAVALPSSASADDDHVLESGCNPMVATTLNTAHLDFKAQIRQSDGSSKTVTSVDPDVINNIAPGSNIEIGIRGEFADNKISDTQLCWAYPLPMNYESVQGMEDMWDYAGTTTKAKLSIVHDDKGNAYLQINFNKDWVEANDKHFQFNYPLTVDGSKLNIPAGGKADWKFPGASNNVQINIAGYDVTGNKNCWYDSGVTVNTEGNYGMKCEVTFNAESDMTNFKFHDEWGNDLIVHKDLKFEGPSGQIDSSSYQTSSSDNSMDLTYDSMPKGSYKISYTAEVKKGATDDGWNFVNAKNTAKWHADGLDNWHESTFVPQRKDDNGGGGSGESKHYTYVRKSGQVEKNADGKYVATWQVHVNTGSDKFDLSTGGFVLRDELQSNQQYNTDFGLKIYEGNGTTGTLAKEIPSAVFSGMLKNKDEVVSKDENDNDRKCNGSQCFAYDFKDSGLGAQEATLVYQTILDTNAAGSFNNMARLDEKGQERENANASVTASDSGDVTDLITKTVSQNAEEVGTNSLGTTVYKVPWTITIDPTKTTKQFTDLNFYEDWVNGDSDGNTEHMWYTGSTLGLKVEECGTGTLSTSADADTSNDDGCSSSTDVTSLFRVKYRNGSANLPDRKDNYDYPKGWYRDNAGENDDNSLHDGVPAFKLEDNGYRDQKTENGVYKKKLRVTYYTLFDGNPDTYKNYAKIDYKLAGQYKNDVVSAEFKYNKGNYVGKTLNAEQQGSSSFSDKATFQTVDEIAQEYVARGLAKDFDAAKLLVEQKYPQGRWVAHWRVWANGTKSWWVPGYSGLQDLTNVENISLHDALPDGWSIAQDRPIYGRFVSGDLSPEDQTQGKSEHWETFRLATEGNCSGDPYTYTDVEGTKVTANPVCATYTLSKGGFDVQVPNDGTLTSYRTKSANDDEPDAANPAGPVGVQGKSVVVFSYDTYITPETLADNGYEIGNTNVYTNHANVKFDDEKIVNVPASGNVTVSTSNVLTKEKRGGENYNKGEAIYQVSINNPNQYALSSGDTIELTDSLDPTAYYAPLSQVNGTTTFIAATLDGNDSKVVDPGQITYKIKQDPTTLAQTMTISIPKTLTWTEYNQADQWDNGAPIAWGKGEIKNTGTVTNPTSLRLLYRVRARGIPGQRVKIKNKVQLTGSSTWVSTEAVEADVRRSSGIVSAAGSTTLTKKGNDDDATLAGAKFKICKVDLSKAADQQDWQHCTAVISDVMTGSNGTVRLTDSTDGLHYGSAYVAIETVAPSGYAVNQTPYYFTLPQPEQPAAGTGTIPTDCDDATCSTQYNNIARWATTNNVQFSGATDGDLTVYDELLEADAEWQKADSGKLQITGDSVNVSNFLAGSSWKFENTDSSCSAKASASTSRTVSLPCTFIVKDNGRRIVKDGQTPQLADENKASGLFKVSGFPFDVTYNVTEEQAPDGYAKRSEVYQFKVDADGNVSWHVQGEPTDSSTGSDTNYQRQHGLYVFTVSGGSSTSGQSQYNVITDNPLLTTMPFTGRFGGVGMWLAMGLVLGVSSFGLFMSTGKERRPRASHSRV